MKNVKYKLIATAAVIAGLTFLSSNKVLADSNCESNYGGGETCIINKRFEISKKVRIQGDDEWKSKVTDVSENDVIEFRIRIKNKTDEDADIDFDNMKMSDYLPDEMYRVGGDGLTEYWDNFEPGDEKTFVIEAKVKSDEYDRDENFSKCVVNKAKAEWDGKFEGSDTATVCYGTPTELPKTGAVSVTALLGTGSLIAGIWLKKRKAK